MVQPWPVDGTPTRNHSESLFPLASNVFLFGRCMSPSTLWLVAPYLHSACLQICRLL